MKLYTSTALTHFTLVNEIESVDKNDVKEGNNLSE